MRAHLQNIDIFIWKSAANLYIIPEITRSFYSFSNKTILILLKNVLLKSFKFFSKIFYFF